MGTSIQGYDLSAEDYGGKEGCNEYLVLIRPQLIEEIHALFLEAGCDVLETDTFGGSRLKLDEYGLGDRTYEQNYEAARLARSVADSYSTASKPRWVAGSIGPTGMLPSSADPTLSAITYRELAELFREQVSGLVEGGADLLLIETAQDILEVKAAIAGARLYFQESGRKVPIQAQVTLDTSGRMLLGTDALASLVTLQSLNVDVIGLNCSTGPEHMREPIRLLTEHSPVPVSVIPNAGIPLNENGLAVYPLDPEGLARAHYDFVRQNGVTVVGGCCGTTPEHMRAVAEALEGASPLQRDFQRLVAVSSGVRATDLKQDPPPHIVGERVNSQGSRRMKRLLLADAYDSVLQIARNQVDGGAHSLDICVALTERSDEADMMRSVVRSVASGVEVPLMIDTTDADTARLALENYPGRAIINSVNLENGRERIDSILPMAVEHGSAVVALTIDEEGMAHTAERKLEIARRIHGILVDEYGLTPDSIIFDVLTFPVTTGQEELARSAVETLEGIRRVKAELPGVLTSLGVSNVSFGVTPHARAALNSVFLYHAVQAGLDLALVHPQEITPYAEIPAEERRICEDLLRASDTDALPRFIQFYENKTDSDVVREIADPTLGMSPEEKIHYQILHRKKEAIEALLDEAFQRQSPVDVLNNVLLPAMKDVGDKFGAGELILPFVLQSAEVMKKAVAHLEKFLDRKEGYTKGKIVLATVFGDVHDIGKSLVNTILSNNGYTVFDLGKQVPINTIIEKAQEVDADAIGLSALLVSTSKQMPLCVQELAKRGMQVPVIIGGAAINRNYGRRIGFVPDSGYYEPGVFYARDAFEGLDIMDKLSEPQARAEFVSQVRLDAEKYLEREEGGAARVATVPRPVSTQGVSKLDRVPEPPFWGARVLDSIPLERVWENLDLNTLYRLHWGARNASGERWEQLVREEFEPKLEDLKARAAREGFILPRAVYGYFPANSQGDDLVVYDPDTGRETARMTFPRQPDDEHLCLADYYLPEGEGRDVVAFQVVTAGSVATELIERLEREGNYSDAYFVHGLAVQTAEALAEYVHKTVREELGLGPEQGRRYSWGYPACPDLSQQEDVMRLLPAEDSIGVHLTVGHQLVPEQSTAALVVHHPQAKYFSARGLTAAARS
ncbi:MAG: methionine synthase [Chloroflexota bacterium]|nr:methionine synthase [Chloroflexota bacterium]